MRLYSFSSPLYLFPSNATHANGKTIHQSIRKRWRGATYGSSYINNRRKKQITNPSEHGRVRWSSPWARRKSLPAGSPHHPATPTHPEQNKTHKSRFRFQPKRCYKWTVRLSHKCEHLFCLCRFPRVARSLLLCALSAALQFVRV